MSDLFDLSYRTTSGSFIAYLHEMVFGVIKKKVRLVDDGCLPSNDRICLPDRHGCLNKFCACVVGEVLTITAEQLKRIEIKMFSNLR